MSHALSNWRRPGRGWLAVLFVLVVAAAALLARPVLDSAARPIDPADLPQAVPGGQIVVGRDYHHDTSPPLREMPQVPIQWGPEKTGPSNPRPNLPHKNAPDPVVQSVMAPLAMPTPILNFDGIGFPGVACNCAPPDTDGEVGATQYVQMVNEGYQVFNKTTGASVLGPSSIVSVWSGFGGVCETGGAGDPVVLYDQLANRWLISQFAGGSTITDECVAVSTTSDATGSWNRYGFHLGSNFFDYPHLGVWPDGYYMSMNVFNAAGTAYLGPQPFVFNRSAMLTGAAATFQTNSGPMGGTVDPLLPADLDGSIQPTSGAPETFARYPSGGITQLYHFHVDWTTPANSSFTSFTGVASAAYTQLCSGGTCVPQSGTTNTLDTLGDRLMFRLAYRKFTDGHEALVGNYTVSSGGVGGIRWFEIRNPTVGPATMFQESTYQPDTTYRWMGSAAMDVQGNLALGFSASSATIFPQIRYAGRLVTDPVGTLGQGETVLFAGTGAQTTGNTRWGDYSDLTVDPVDDCTFWFTSEYYSTNASFAWKTRIGNFKFPGCTLATVTPTPTGTLPTATQTPTITQTPTATQTPCGTTLLTEGFESGLGQFASTVATCAPGGCGWTAVPTPHTGTNAAFAPDGGNISDQRLTLTAALAIPASATSATLSFWHKYAFENSSGSFYDGGVLETSTDGGTNWIDIGANITSGGYGGAISTCCSNPLAGRQGWVATQATYTQVTVNLISFAGQNLLFRFREGTDSSVAATGWWIDDINVSVTTPCSATSTATRTSTATSTATVTQTSVPNTATSTATRTSTATNTATATSTTVPPTNTSTATATRTSTATNTTVPPTSTNTSTATATSTGVPPTGTSTATRTGTATVTQTGVPPSATATQTGVPNTATSTATRTSTSVPNTATSTSTSVSNTATATSTGVSNTATSTSTSVSNTATATSTGVSNTATATSTGVSNTATSTSTSVPNTATSTSTSVPNTATVTRTATATATVCAISFSDVQPADYFYAPVLYLACHGVIGGYSDGTYRPYNNTTRGQMAKIVVGAFGLPIQTPAAGGYTFADTPVGSTFFNFVETAATAGIVTGYPCGGTNPQTGQTELCDGASRPYYRGGNFVTRGQLSKIVVIAAQQVQGWTLISPTTATFSDVPVGSTFFTYIETAACHSILGGYSDGTFRPSANATRGQIAKIVYFALGSGASCGPAATPPALR